MSQRKKKKERERECVCNNLFCIVCTNTSFHDDDDDAGANE